MEASNINIPLLQGIAGLPAGVQKRFHQLLYGDNNILAGTGFIGAVGLRRNKCTTSLPPDTLFATSESKVSVVEVTLAELQNRIGLDVTGNEGKLSWSNRCVFLKLNSAGFSEPDIGSIELALQYACEGVSYVLTPQMPGYHLQVLQARKLAQACANYGLIFLCEIQLKHPHIQSVTEALQKAADLGHIIKVQCPCYGRKQKVNQELRDAGVIPDDLVSILKHLRTVCYHGRKPLLVGTDLRDPEKIVRAAQKADIAGVSFDSVLEYEDPKPFLRYLTSVLAGQED